MTGKNKQKKGEGCSLCKISEETLERLKNSKPKKSMTFPVKQKQLYKCPECGFEYGEKEWAEKCELWCKEHKTCNLEIIEHAVKTK